MKNDDFRLPFGSHQGKTFKDVPLEYLDWLIGWLEETDSQREPGKKLSEAFGTLYRAAIDYLENNQFGMESTDIS